MQSRTKASKSIRQTRPIIHDESRSLKKHMNPAVFPAETLERLYTEFADCIRANNPETLRDAYRKLIYAGRPLAEILDAGIRAAAGTRTDFEDLLLGARDKTQMPKEAARSTIVEQTDPVFTHSGKPNQTPTSKITDVGAIKLIFYSRILWFAVEQQSWPGRYYFIGLYGVPHPHGTLAKSAVEAPLFSLNFAQPGHLLGTDPSIRAVLPEKAEPLNNGATVETLTRLPDTPFPMSTPQTPQADQIPTPTTQKYSASVTAAAAQAETLQVRPILSSAEIAALVTRGDSFCTRRCRVRPAILPARRRSRRRRSGASIGREL